MEHKLIANSLVPDNEVWVSPKTWDSPFTQSKVAQNSTALNTESFQFPELVDVIGHVLKNVKREPGYHHCFDIVERTYEFIVGNKKR